MVVSCLDEEACVKCLALVTAARARCYCMTNPKLLGMDKGLEEEGLRKDEDGYASPVWSRAVRMKVAVAREIAHGKLRAVFSDHDVVVTGNLDHYFTRGPTTFFGEQWARGPKPGRPNPDAPPPALVTMCDFPRKFRPMTREANTGFMLIDGTMEGAQLMVDAWAKHVVDLEASGVKVDNDQPPFQAVSQKKDFLYVHKCADEDVGLAMWFHRKGRLTGSGLDVSYYSERQSEIRVFHTNDVKTSEDKINLLKRLQYWFQGNKTEVSVNGTNGTSFMSATRVNSGGSMTGNRRNQSSMDEGPDYRVRRISSDTGNQWELDRVRKSPSTGRKFFIYDWPFDVVHIADNSTEARERFQDLNFGAGPVIDPSIGQFNTYMHSLWPLVYQRLMHHPRRTRKASEAAFYFVPYDVSRDAYTKPLGAQVAPRVMDLLMTSPFFQLHPEKHFFVDSSEPFWAEKKRVVELFYKNMCAKCIQMTPSKLVPPYQMKWARSVLQKMDNSVLIPYTSTWHYHEIRDGRKKYGESPEKPWAWEFSPDEIRQHKVVFVGIIKKMNVTATATRRALLKECNRVGPSRCVHKVLGHDKWLNFGAEAEIYRKSDFCFLPGGDIAARKAIIDMLMVGCIPIVFEWGGQINFPWHIGDAAARLVALEIEVFHWKVQQRREMFKHRGRPLNLHGVVDDLEAIPQSEIIGARVAMRKLAWQLQYSVVPLGLRSDEVWSPPHPDAVDTIVKHVLDM